MPALRESSNVDVHAPIAALDAAEMLLSADDQAEWRALSPVVELAWDEDDEEDEDEFEDDEELDDEEDDDFDFEDDEDEFEEEGVEDDEDDFEDDDEDL